MTTESTTEFLRALSKQDWHETGIIPESTEEIMHEFCGAEIAHDQYQRESERLDSEWEKSKLKAQTNWTDYEQKARDWLLSTRKEDFWPDYPRGATGVDVLMEAVGCTDDIAQVSIGKVLFGIAMPEETELCNHKLGLLVEEYAEKFKERDIRRAL